jgi:hypothetical protein
VRPRPALLLGALVAPALPLLVAGPAHAATTNVICVNRSDADCTQPATSIQDAIDKATADGMDSVMRIGKGTYTGPFTFDGSTSPLTVQGNGNGTGDQATVFTVLTNNGSPYLTATHATLRNVRVEVKDVGATGVRATAGSTLQQVIVADTPSAVATGATGFNVSDSLVQESSANLDRGSGNNGMFVTGTTAQPAALRRVTVRASQSGVRAVEGPVAIENSVVALGASGATGLGAGLPQTVDGVTLSATYVTVVGGAPGSRGVEAFSDDPAAESTVTLRNSIVRGPGTTLTADGAAAVVDVSYSDYHPPGQQLNGGAVHPGAGNIDADPLFRDPADDLQLRVGSPVVDKALSTVTDGPDRNGDGRAFDGDGNGSQVPDMGAYELRDITAPKTTFTAGPNGPTNDSTPVFAFKSEDGARFACSLDGGAFQACSSPATTTPFTDGPHSFAVRATDEAFNLENPPAIRRFTVDTTTPNATITKKPAKRFFKKRVKFKFATDEAGATFECDLDGRGWKKCQATFRFNTKVGKHRLLVRAVDTAGNIDPTPARYKYRRLQHRR